MIKVSYNFFFILVVVFILVSQMSLAQSANFENTEDMYIELGQKAFEFLEDSKSVPQDSSDTGVELNYSPQLSLPVVLEVSQILLPFLGISFQSFEGMVDPSLDPLGVLEKEDKTATSMSVSLTNDWAEIKNIPTGIENTTLEITKSIPLYDSNYLSETESLDQLNPKSNHLNTNRQSFERQKLVIKRALPDNLNLRFKYSEIGFSISLEKK